MTTELAFSEMISHAARICGPRSEYTFLKSDQSVDKLEHRSRRVRSLHCSVEHRLVWVRKDLVVVLSEVCEHVYIDTRTGHHRQNLAGGRLDGYKAAHLVVHEHLSVVLECGVDGGGYIITRHGLLVQRSVLIP